MSNSLDEFSETMAVEPICTMSDAVGVKYILG